MNAFTIFLSKISTTVWAVLTGALLTLSAVGWASSFWNHAKYVKAAKATTAAIESCNTRTAIAARDAAEVVRNAEKTAYENKLNELASQAHRERIAREIAEEAEARAKAGILEHEIIIEQLMLEASIDDIPDSNECLNVFVPERIVSGLRLRPRACPGVGPGSRPGSHPACPGAQGADEDDFPSEYFSDITFGDGFVAWRKDRGSLMACNGQLQAIEALNEGVSGGYSD